MISEVLGHLERLVAFDTRNPPREMTSEGIFGYLREQLPGFRTETIDLGDGYVYLFAVRGDPSVIFHVHLDTVPAAEGWQSDPLRMEVSGDRAVGLGTCDIKGAAACLVVAAARSTAPAAFLFTSDEEGAAPRCVRHFLTRGSRFQFAVIGEPTLGRGVTVHRGITSFRALFRGSPGHGSDARALAENSNHRAGEWVSSALTLARQEELVGFGGLSGIRLNIGRIEGGIKPNMIAGSTLVRGAMRLTPAHDPQEIVAKLRALSPAEYLESFEVTFQGPSLPALRGAEAERQRACAEGWLDELRLPKGDAQDFWSEAAIFSEAGIPSVMLGPGSIAQAHQAGEWVSLLSLEDVTKTYMRIIDGGQ